MPAAQPHGLELSWDDLRVFLALQREGTLAGAARRLGVNATTVSRRVASFEARLGTPLLTRSPDGYIATPRGASLIAHAEAIEHHATLAARELSGESAKLEGEVRLAVTEHFSSHFLIDHLRSFRSRHPRIELQLITQDALSDLSRGEADIAVRFARPGGVPVGRGSDDLRAQRVCRIGIGVFASRDYLDHRGRPESANDVRGHDLIVSREESRFMPGYDWTAKALGHNHVSVRTDGMSVLAAACEAGFGLCALPVFFALRHSNVERIEPPDIVDSRDAWLLMPPELRRVARVRAVWDFLVELFDHWEPLMSGRIRPEAAHRRFAERR